MLHNNDAEMSEILSIYPHFIDLTAPFHSLEFEGRLHKVGQSLYAKGGIDLVRKVLIDLRHQPEGYSDDFISYLATVWPTRSSPNLPQHRRAPRAR
jgi:hypothetical protein